MHLPCILSLHFATGCRDWSFHVLYLHWFILSMDCWVENFLSYDLFHNYDRYWILLYFCVSVVQMAIKSTVRTSSVLIQRNHRWVLEMYYYQLSISVHATGLQRATESLLHFQANCDSIKTASHATGLKEFSNYVLSKMVAVLGSLNIYVHKVHVQKTRTIGQIGRMALISKTHRTNIWHIHWAESN